MNNIAIQSIQIIPTPKASKNNSINVSSFHPVCLPNSQTDIFCEQNKNNGDNVSFKGFMGIPSSTLKKILRLFPLKFTKYDTPEVLNMRKALLENNYKIAPPCDSLERIQLRTQIVEHLIKSQPDINKTKNFYFVIGRPGSGKSTLSESIAKSKKTFHIDFDAINLEIPECAQNQTLRYVYRNETMDMRNQILKFAVENDYDFILESCGIYYKKMVQTIEEMENKGYKIHLKMVDLPVDKSVQRAMHRFNETKRFSDPLINVFYGNKPIKTYKKLLKKFCNYLSSHELYSSDVPKGEAFKLIPEEVKPRRVNLFS